MNILDSEENQKASGIGDHRELFHHNRDFCDLSTCLTGAEDLDENARA